MSTTASTANLSWSPVIGATVYQVGYRPLNQSQPQWTMVGSPTNTITLTGLASNTVYEAQIRAQCGAEFSNFSNLLTFSTQSCTPPLASVSSISASAATLTWAAVPTATSYRILYDEANVMIPTWTVLNTTATSRNITGLSPNTLYQARLLTKCGTEFSDTSAVIYFSTNPCEVPNGLQAIAFTASSITLSWLSAAGASQYQVAYQLVGDTAWTNVNASDTFKVVSGLTSNSNYILKVRTKCGSIWSDYSLPIYAATGPCFPPTNILISNIKVNSFTVNYNQGLGATQYQIRYRALGSTSWTTVTTTLPQRTITGLSQDTEYQIQIRSKCGTSAFSAYSPMQNVRTAKCEIPTDITLKSLNLTQVEYDWLAVNHATQYQIQYRLLSDSLWYYSVTSDTNYRRITGLSEAQTYELRIRTRCAAAIYSDYSDTLILAMPYCDLAPAFRIDSIGYKEVRFKWYSALYGDRVELNYRKTGDTTWTRLVVSDTVRKITGLEQGTNYEALIRTRCSSSIYSYYGDTLRFTTLGCGVPTYIWVDSVDYKKASLRWTSVGASLYRVEYRVHGDTVWKVKNTTTNRIDLTGLEEGILYEARVKARCAPGVFSETYHDTVYFRTSDCLAPWYLIIDTLSSTNLRLRWPSVSGVSTYRLEYRLVGDTAWSRYTVSDTFRVFSRTSSEANYEFRVSSRCAPGVFSEAKANKANHHHEPCDHFFVVRLIDCNFIDIMAIANSYSEISINEVNEDGFIGEEIFEDFVNASAIYNRRINPLNLNDVVRDPGTFIICIKSVHHDCPPHCITIKTGYPVTVRIDPIPQIICEGEPIVLTAHLSVTLGRSNDPETYHWTPGINPPEPFSGKQYTVSPPLGTTTYTVTAWGKGDTTSTCTSTATVTVTVVPRPSGQLTCQPFCLAEQGEAILTNLSPNVSVQASALINNTNTPSTLVPNPPNGFRIRTTPNQSGQLIYQVTLTDNLGCQTILTCTTTVYPIPEVNILAQQLENNNTLLSTSVNGGSGTYQYSWTSNPPGLFNPPANGSEMIAPNISQPTTVTVTVTDANGCSASSSTVLTPPQNPCGHLVGTRLQRLDSCELFWYQICIIPPPTASTFRWQLPPAAPTFTSVPCTTITYDNRSGDDLISFTYYTEEDSCTGILRLQDIEDDFNFSPYRITVSTARLLPTFPNNNTPIVINPTTYNTNRLIWDNRGDFKFNRNVTFQNMDIVVNDSSIRFLVMADVRLRFVNCRISAPAGVNWLWKGIEIAYALYPTGIVELDNVVLEDAEIGINVPGGGSALGSRGLVDVFRSCLNQNRVHIQFDYNVNNWNSQTMRRHGINSPLILEASVLECRRELNDAHSGGATLRTDIGVNIYDVSAIEIGVRNRGTNLIRQARLGINADRARLNIVAQNNFHDMCSNNPPLIQTVGVCFALNRTRISRSPFLNFLSITGAQNRFLNTNRNRNPIFGFGTSVDQDMQVGVLVDTVDIQGINVTQCFFQNLAINPDSIPYIRVYNAVEIINSRSYPATTCNININNNQFNTVARGILYNNNRTDRDPLTTLNVSGNTFNNYSVGVSLNQNSDMYRIQYLIGTSTPRGKGNTFNNYNATLAPWAGNHAAILAFADPFNNPALTTSSYIAGIFSNTINGQKNGIIIRDGQCITGSTGNAQGIRGNRITNIIVDGISVTNENNYLILRNRILNLDSTIRGNNGIIINNCLNSQIGCNGMSNFTNAFHAQDICNNTRLTANVFDNANNGIRLTDIKALPVIGDQGSPTDPWYNVWNNCIFHSTTSPDTDLSLSEIYVNDCIFGGTFCTDPSACGIPGASFSLTIILSPMTCPSAGAAPAGSNCDSGTNWPFALLIANKQPNLEYENKVMLGLMGNNSQNYTARQKLFEELAEKPERRYQSEYLNTWFHQNKQGNFAKLYQIHKLKAIGRYSAAAQLNNSLIPQNNFEVLEKQLNGIAIKFAAGGKGALNQQDSIQIVQIAEQCPITGGRAVERARVLRMMFDHYYMRPYSNACGSLLMREDKEDQAPKERLKLTDAVYNLYPNPAQNQFTISYQNDPKLGAVRLEVSTLTGQLVFSTDLAGEQGSTAIDSHSWGSGIYLCKFVNYIGQVIEGQKLIIAR